MVKHIFYNVVLILKCFANAFIHYAPMEFKYNCLNTSYVFRKMPHKYIRKTARCMLPEKKVCVAINMVIKDKKSIRDSAKINNIPGMTLYNRLKKYKVSSKLEEINKEYAFSSKYTNWQIFTIQQEELLVTHLIKSSKVRYGHTYKQVRKLSYDYSLSLGIKIKKSWSDNQLAGVDWMKGFMRRHPSLNLHKPENTSLSQATSFNQVNVSELFVNYEKALGKHKIPPNRIFNIDETGISTVMQTPCLVAPKRIKQVGKLYLQNVKKLSHFVP